MNLLYSILQSQGDKVKKKRLNRSMWRCPPQYYKHRTVQMLQKKDLICFIILSFFKFFFVCFFWGWLKNTMLQKPKGKAAFTTVNNTKNNNKNGKREIFPSPSVSSWFGPPLPRVWWRPGWDCRIRRRWDFLLHCSHSPAVASPSPWQHRWSDHRSSHLKPRPWDTKETIRL